MSALLIDDVLMSALAQAAATFIAILAGFYTSKILTIAGDKNRIEHKINYVNSEIAYETENIANLKSLRNKLQKEMEDSRLQDFENIIKNEANIPNFKGIDTFNGLVECYKNIFMEQPSKNILINLKTKSDLLIRNLKTITENRLKKNTFSTPSPLYSLSSDGASRIIEETEYVEEQQNFDNLKRELVEKENKIKFLNQQLSLNKDELHSLVYPKHLKFGFFSFVLFALFALLGVIIPLTHQWWSSSPYIVIDSDIFAFSMFLIGLIITFIYIFSEIIFLFNKSSRN